MSAAKSMDTYLNNHYTGMSPEKLIHMLFKGAIKQLQLAKEGILENNIKKRGEHLSKAISIISELNSSLDPEINDESIKFLRGLYTSILTELPKASLTNEIKPIELSCTYIEKLNDIWETTVLNSDTVKKQTPPSRKAGRSYPVGGGYGYANSTVPKSFFV